MRLRLIALLFLLFFGLTGLPYKFGWLPPIDNHEWYGYGDAVLLIAPLYLTAFLIGIASWFYILLMGSPSFYSQYWNLGGFLSWVLFFLSVIIRWIATSYPSNLASFINLIWPLSPILGFQIFLLLRFPLSSLRNRQPEPGI